MRKENLALIAKLVPSLRKFTGFLGSISILCAQPVLADRLTKPEPELHITQAELNNILVSEGSKNAFRTAFDVGDELFEHPFIAEEGAGANVGNGQLFTLVPRADLSGQDEWATHSPKRVTGPNAQSCNICHGQPVGDGAGPVVMNNVRDPLHSGDMGSFINRQPPHIFGIGALQRLAEEMSEELEAVQQQARTEALASNSEITLPLSTKGIEFGTITAFPDGTLNTSMVEGIDSDLLVKPIEWKGITPYIRAFVRDANHNELGMQAVEIAGDGIDGDGDGVADELSVGDITAMVIYQAAQPRPTTKRELARLGIIPRLSSEEITRIERGKDLFTEIECASCHKPELTLNDPVFQEPSRNPNYRDETFPAGQDPVQRGIDPQNPISFDLTRDIPDNIIRQRNGRITHLGNFQRNTEGGAIVRLYGDLKRHDMGAELAESIDEAGTGASVFITKELWGVGSTAPYLHDGRATTLAEAILLHGGEGADSQHLYQSLPDEDQTALITYLNNLVLYKNED
ncbi:di-heme oxidoredictase family protein [Motiliproteus sp. MSK22-1]|uniref:di-heme oxidoredictase family protein n=1 Tax=Motiliproteus sp. MSK22-1 TaxID=1897630 RepID=UPI000977DBDD|nr:di-heme oxidoredictase family protein [Motiliproteus sp. MSK22-1]OMH25778.1 hypothetical protein BGP75_24965 [Motiliproteus sp. MSK22-1]